MQKSPVFKMIILIILAVLLLVCTTLAGIYIDYMEYLEIGKNLANVFWVDFNAKLITMVMSFFFAFVLLFSNLLIVRNNLTGIDNSFSYLKKNVWVILISFILSVIVSVVSNKTITDTIMPYLNSEFFGKGDPIFYNDIGYYVFQRPFYISISELLLNFSSFLIFSTIFLYVIFYGKFDFYNMKNITKEKGVIIHIISLIMVYFLIKAVTYKFVKEDILYNNQGNFLGADYVDLKVWLKFYNIAPVIILAVVVITTIFILRTQIKPAIITVMVYPVLFVVTTIIASVVNLMVVDPNELAIQSEYIQHNIDYTRSAYNLDASVERDYPVNYNLDEEKILNNLDTVDNIRINDFDQTVVILNQLQSLKTYYSFSDSDIVTYTLDGEQTAVSIAAREINTSKIEDSAKNYINTKMKYTHGFGVVANKINTVNENGQPDFIVKDIPVISEYEELAVKEPRIYYGETSNDYVIVGTKDGESDDVYGNGYSYQGSAGIGLNFFNRLILAIKEADLKLLISDQITSNSKILVNTNIKERVNKIAPFLTYDADPTIVIDDDGSLKWILDAYTTTPYYPYSEYYADYNYIRNSVKVVVDAYNGTTKFYIIDQNDPIIKSYARIYPDLFEKEEFPESLAEHVRYPMDIFNVQSNMLKKYHIKNATEFYQKKGVWSISNEKISENMTAPVKPYYNYMSIDGDKAELVLMLPYTLANKDNMISWLAVRCTGENYGQMVIYNFSQSENIVGTYQVENRIDSDSEISKDISLWESSGSSVIRGNMLIIPIENNILYVEPIYITSGNDASALPQIARIVLSYNNKVVSETTLSECFKTMFGVNRPDEEEDQQDEDVNYYINKTIEGYETLKEYMQSGDWENFGKYMDILDNNINNLKAKINIGAEEEKITENQ